MFKKWRVLAFVPARGGSRGLPGKNVRRLGGKPLIAWTLAQANKCRFLDRIVVSTDHPEIARIAKRCGGEVPFRRPARLAAGRVPTIDVCQHALDWFEKRGECFDVLILLQPTSPLRLAEDIAGAMWALFSRKAGSIVSVTESEHHPWWANRLPGDGSMKGFLPKSIENKNRLELPRYYRLNGAIYAAKTEYLRRHNKFIGPRTFAYVMPPERSVDIDTELDFRLAEILLRDVKGGLKRR